jgi:hypothetical protein
MAERCSAKAPPMLIAQRDSKLTGEIYDWLLAHKEEIRAGTAEYMGTPVSEATIFRQYEYVASLIHFTSVVTTPHLLPTRENGHLALTGLKYTFLTVLLGWWGFPLGPLLTVQAIFVNLSGGRKRTAASLLQLLECGWDSPDVVPIGRGEHVVNFTDRALQEISRRRAAGGFGEQLGIRIAPGGYADNEVEISFDFAVSDGRDWIDRTQGLVVLFDGSDVEQLVGCAVDFEDGVFRAHHATAPRR